jgi:hypothetical protein
MGLITSRFTVEVARQRDLQVEGSSSACAWSTRPRTTTAKFPAGYVNAHGGGRRMLRIAAAARTMAATRPRRAYTALGEELHTGGRSDEIRAGRLPRDRRRGRRGLPPELVARRGRGARPSCCGRRRSSASPAGGGKGVLHCELLPFPRRSPGHLSDDDTTLLPNDACADWPHLWALSVDGRTRATALGLAVTDAPAPASRPEVGRASSRMRRGPRVRSMPAWPPDNHPAPAVSEHTPTADAANTARIRAEVVRVMPGVARTCSSTTWRCSFVRATIRHSRSPGPVVLWTSRTSGMRASAAMTTASWPWAISSVVKARTVKPSAVRSTYGPDRTGSRRLQAVELAARCPGDAERRTAPAPRPGHLGERSQQSAIEGIHGGHLVRHPPAGCADCTARLRSADQTCPARPHRPMTTIERPSAARPPAASALGLRRALSATPGRRPGSS